MALGSSANAWAGATGKAGAANGIIFDSATENMNIPVRGYRFLFTADGANITASFKEISGGFKAGQEAKEYREGGFARATVRKVPGGIMTFDDITLSKGIMHGEQELWNFNDSFLEGGTDNCIPLAHIAVYDPKGVTEVLGFDLMNVWPKEWTMDNSLSADSSDILIEKVTLSVEGVTRTV